MILRDWIGAAGVMTLAAGVLLILCGRRMRQRRGLGGGKTVALDNVKLTSWRYGLTGRPDRMIREGDTIIPEEWKRSRQVWPNHLAPRRVFSADRGSA
jgi:CRISPR-associated exonuclease Cas4